MVAAASATGGGGGGMGLALVCIGLMIVLFAVGLYLSRNKGGGGPEGKLGLGPVIGGAEGPGWPVGGDEGDPGAWPNPGAWPAGDGFEVARDTEPPAASPDPDFSPLLSYGYPYNFSLESPDPVEVGENRMYSSAEVDPRITGQLYAGARAAGVGRQFIYGNRVSFGDRWGMREFSSGVPGQVGVDVGPYGLSSYSLDGTPDVFGDDGVPSEWLLPSTPPNWYRPKQRDYYNVETRGPSVYEPNLMPLMEGDHEPLFG